jgi:hypothetical protein
MAGPRVIVASLGAMLAACGSQTIVSGSGADGGADGGVGAVPRTTVTGTVAGMAVPTTDTTAFVRPLVGTFGPFTRNGVVIEISNVASLCTLAQSGVTPVDSVWFKIIVAAPAPVVAGTYAISNLQAEDDPSSTLGVLTFATPETGDAGCSAYRPHSAVSGSIALMTVNSTTVEGTFRVTMSSGEPLSGTFSAPVCDAPSDAGTFICGI